MKAYSLFLFFILFLSNSFSAVERRAFYITKSKHPKNIVCYDVKISKNCKININDPIDIYWILGDTGNGERDGLSFLEKRLAYGIYDLKVFSPYKISFRLNGRKDIEIFVEMDKTFCKPKAYVFIKGKVVVFESMFFKLLPGGSLIPKIEYLEFVFKSKRVRLFPNEI